MASLYEQLGGESKLRAIIHDFVGRVFADTMIGFMFRKVDRARLEELETQQASLFLGGPLAYAGRPLDAAHARHKIQGGQFARRKKILEETLDAHGVSEPIRRVWLEHTDALRPLITGQPDTTCE
jgi:truncated hemoglobin YjbI